ncbi:hypothetical protein [Streptomyces sp. NPDC058084]|uniref:hypothetical protein n=1 Tax=Streptomyces sp. NPDC058084 TaxID=3346333 RepID=UPI0036EF113C
MTAPAAPAADVRAECQFDLHSACKVGEVRTPTFGDLVFTVSCACPCHRPTKEATRG